MTQKQLDSQMAAIAKVQALRKLAEGDPLEAKRRIEELFNKRSDRISLSSLLRSMDVSASDPRARKELCEALMLAGVTLSTTKHRSEVQWKNLSEAVGKAMCLSDLARELHLQPHGGNLNTVKRLLEEHNITTDHFDVAAARRRNKQELTLAEVFTEHSKVSRATLKRWAQREGLEYKCAGCNNVGKWKSKLGQEIILVLDHINGINDDNRKENLRFLCSNCNSQTPTFAGRNK